MVFSAEKAVRAQMGVASFFLTYMPAAGHVNAREKEEKVETILALLIQAQTIPWVGWALAWALLFRTSSAQ